MRSTLCQIGSERAITIPAALLAECGITDDIELSVDKGCLIVSPAKPARVGWFDNYRSEPETDAWEGITETPNEQEEWEW